MAGFTLQTTVAEVLAEMPLGLGVFVEHGFATLRDENVRQTIGKTITIADAARLHGVEASDLLDGLKALRERLAACDGRFDSSIGGPIIATQTPGGIVEEYPHLLDVFLRHGFDALRNDELRRSVATMVTLETACRMHGVDLDQLLVELNTNRASG